MTKQTQWNVGYVIFAVIGLPMLQMWNQARVIEVLPYSGFERELEAGKVEGRLEMNSVARTDRSGVG